MKEPKDNITNDDLHRAVELAFGIKTVKVTFDGEKYSADATWLPGAPPVAREWSSQEMAIAVLKEMIEADNRLENTDWGKWPKHYNVEIEEA